MASAVELFPSQVVMTKRLLLLGTQSEKPTLWGARCNRRGAWCRTVDGVAISGVLLALERHLILAKLVAVHATVWAGQNNAHVTAGSSTNIIKLTSHFSMNTVCSANATLGPVQAEHTNASFFFYLLQDGGGGNLWFWVQSFSFLFLFVFSALQC